MKKRLIIIFAIIFSLLLIGVAVGGYLVLDMIASPPDREIKHAQHNGDLIVAAIEEFKADHDALPMSINELVTEYIIEIPDTTQRSIEWKYFVRDGGKKYELNHDWGDWKPVTYTSGGSWAVDTR